jgi:hypothetical protein
MNKNKKGQTEQTVLPEEELYVEETISYTRTRRLYAFVCALEKCPYCQNVPMKAKNPTRKWCSEEARAEAGRRERAAKAIEAGRVPGKVGNPLIEEDKLSQMGVFFIHALDKLPDVYRIGHANSWEIYENEYLSEAAAQHDFDAIVIVRTPLADLLARKITRKFGDHKVAETLYHLDVADVRVAHQMVLEHVEAHRG